MEGTFRLFFGAACFLAAKLVQGADAVLPMHGSSEALTLLSTFPRPAEKRPAGDRGLFPLRSSAAAVEQSGAGTPRPSHARRPLPFVNTGGARLNIEGLHAPAGSVNGAAGAFQFVQVAGGVMAVYRKEDGERTLGPVPVNALFAGASSAAPMHACRSQPVHEAAVYHDQLSMRWIVSYRAGPLYQCIAVSTSADAGGSYARYVMTIADAGGDAQWADDARVAVWSRSYSFSFALFGADGRYLGPRMCSIDRRALAGAREAPYRCADIGPSSGPLSPVRLDGYSLADQDLPALFVGLDAVSASAGSRLHLWRMPQAPGQRAEVITLDVAPYWPACASRKDGSCVSQPAPGAPLPAVGDRIAPGAVYRQAGARALVLLNHPVQLDDGTTALRWYAIADPHGTPALAAQGTLGGGGESRWLGSIGIDRAGNIAMGYNVASSDAPAGIRYTGREGQDPPGMMQTEEFIVNGAGSAMGETGARLSGALSIDPGDGCTFWYTQRYVPATGYGSWRTRIAAFRFRSCR